MKKILKEEIELEFIVGETYITKFTSAERFMVTEVVKDKGGIVVNINGIYENSPHLGICPIDAGRLIPKTEFTGKEFEVNVCPHCKKTFI